MRSVVPVRVAGAVLDVAVDASRTAGVRMAGFRGQADRPLELPVVPYPALTIFIDLGDGIFIDDVDGERTHGSAVVGLMPGAIRGGGQDIDLLQIRLSPAIAQAVLGEGPQLAGSVVALHDLWGSETDRVEARLRAAPSWDARFAIARSELAMRRSERGRVDPEVAHVWRRMMFDCGQIRIEALAVEVGWSRKRLWSRFRSQIGPTPKHAARLIRFDHVAHRLAAGDRAAAVAANSGFADQSHLYRDVLAFTGNPVSAIAGAPWLAVDHVAWPLSAAVV